MKKLAIIGSVLTITAVAATAWQMHGYNREIQRQLEVENTNLREANVHSGDILARHDQLIAALESRLKELTNHNAGTASAAGITKAGSI